MRAGPVHAAVHPLGWRGHRRSIFGCRQSRDCAVLSDTGGEWQGKREEMLRIVKEDVGVNAEELAAHCAENLHTTYLPALAEDSCAKIQSLEESLAQTPLFG